MPPPCLAAGILLDLTRSKSSGDISIISLLHHVMFVISPPCLHFLSIRKTGSDGTICAGSQCADTTVITARISSFSISTPCPNIKLGYWQKCTNYTSTQKTVGDTLSSQPVAAMAASLYPGAHCSVT